LEIAARALLENPSLRGARSAAQGAPSGDACHGVGQRVEPAGPGAHRHCKSALDPLQEYQAAPSGNAAGETAAQLLGASPRRDSAGRDLASFAMSRCCACCSHGRASGPRRRCGRATQARAAMEPGCLRACARLAPAEVCCSSASGAACGRSGRLSGQATSGLRSLAVRERGKLALLVDESAR
jgi:hypothetical protein